MRLVMAKICEQTIRFDSQEIKILFISYYKDEETKGS